MIKAEKKPGPSRDPQTGRYQTLPPKNVLVRPTKQPVLQDVSKGFSGIAALAHNVLMNPDIAVQTDRRMADQMQRDPMITAPLFRRSLATAQLPWQVLPEDEGDRFQMEVAETITRIVSGIPKFVEVLRDLLWATFRGTGVSEMYWAQNRSNEWIIKGHRPHHGDKFTYDIHGNPRIITRDHQHAGRALTQPEIERLIIHTHDPEDGSFFEPREAAYVFKGRGLRDLIWPYWWLKHNALLFWVKFIERFGGGMVIGRYPQGNKPAKEAIESVLKNMINDSKVTLPVPRGEQNREAFGIEIVTVSGNKQTVDAFLLFIDGWAGKHIKLLIEGTQQTTQEAGDGLGSGRAQVLMSIFEQYRDYDAEILQQTLTEQMVQRIQRFNFGDLPFQCRFEFITENTDGAVNARRKIGAARLAGLEVPKTWAYDILGIPLPKEGEETLDLGLAPPAPDTRLGFDGLSAHAPASRYEAQRREFARAFAENEL